MILRSDLEHGNDATRLFERTSAIVVKMMLNHSESELVMRRRNYLSRPKSSGTNVYPTMLKKYNETSLNFFFSHIQNYLNALSHRNFGCPGPFFIQISFQATRRQQTASDTVWVLDAA